MNKSDSIKIGIPGEITARFFDQSNLTDAQKKFNRKLGKMFRAGKIKGADFMAGYTFGPQVAERMKYNVICNAGFETITKALTGDTSSIGAINKAMLGTGTAGAAATDTKLGTETYRNNVISVSYKDNILMALMVFTESEVTGNFSEFGNCIGGTDTVDTGALWSHLTGLSWVKNDETALVVSGKYTFASV